MYYFPLHVIHVEVGGKYEKPRAGIKLQMSVSYSILQKQILDFILHKQREVLLWAAKKIWR